MAFNVEKKRYNTLLRQAKEESIKCKVVECKNEFHHVTSAEVWKVLAGMTNKSCELDAVDTNCLKMALSTL